jgi:hypothetical protein
VKEKLVALFSKLKSSPSGKIGKVIEFIKWTLFLVVGTFVSVLLAVAIWFYLQPLHKLVPRFEGFIRSELMAESVKVEKIHWKFALSYLGVGLQAQNVTINNAPEFKEVKVETLQVVTQPLKIFLGKFPFSIELKNGVMTLPPEGLETASDTKEETLNESTKVFSQTSKNRIDEYLNSTIAKVVRLQFDLKDFAIVSADLKNKLLIPKGKIVISGFPGTFSFEFDSEAEWSAQRWSIAGKANWGFSGFFQTWEGKLVGLKAEGIQVNLTDTEIKHEWGLHKPKDMEVVVSCDSQVIIDAALDIKSVYLSGGKFSVDEIKTDFNLGFKNSKDYSLNWFAGPREMDQLELPIQGLEGIPFKGIFEVNASAKMTEKNGLDAIWKMNFNNFRVDTSKLTNFFDKGSFGEIRFSFVNEVEMKDGQISLPRSEFQLTGTQSQIEMGDHRFIKPKGDPLDILIKAGTKEDNLYLEHINILANNLSFEAKAEVHGFSDFILKAKPGKLKADVLTNTVDLTPWSPYFPIFRKVPLEGTVQFSGSADGPIYSDDNPFREVSWRIDRFSASKIRGSIDRDAFTHLGLPKPKTHMNGPFTFDFLVQGRGYGDGVHRGTFLTHVDLSKMGLVYKERIRKPAGVPLLLDFSVEKSQNRLIVRRGQLKAHEADLVLSGQLAQGSNRSELELKFQKPIKLENWRDFFSNLPKDMPLSGEFKWNGKITFDGQEAMEGNVDLSQLSIEGTGEAKGINFWVSELNKPLTDGVGKILFQKDGVYVADAGFKSGGTEVTMSGSALFKDTKSKIGTITRFLGSDPLIINGQMNVVNWDEGFFSKNIIGETESQEVSRDETAEVQVVLEPLFDLRKYLDDSRFRESEVRIGVTAQASKNAKTKLSKISSMIISSDGKLKADPLHLLLWGGEFKGSVNIDMQPYFDRKEMPIWSTSGEFSTLDIEPLLRVLRSEHASKIGGYFTGSIQWVGEGVDTDEVGKNLRGRIKGEMKDSFLAYLDPLRANMRDIVLNSAASAYYLNDVDVEKCFPNRMKTLFDAQIRDGQIFVQESQYQFQGGTELSAVGSLNRESLSLKGELMAGPSCYTPKVESCFKKLNSKIPFEVTSQGDEISTGVDSTLIGKALADCLDQQIGRNTVSEKNSADPAAPKSESIADKWKKLFKSSE